MTTAVSVGVCAYNEERRIPRLLDSVLGQSLAGDDTLAEVLVVASGCTDHTEDRVLEAAAMDSRVRLLREPVRRGKASAINLLLAQFKGDILVLVNGDAEVLPGSLAHLLDAFRADPTAEVACGSVAIEDGHAGLHHMLEEMQWRIHNRSLATLAGLGTGNHCCDEFMALRRGFLTSLPARLINDGAYIGVVATLRGQAVRFRPKAEVLVETPTTLRGLVQQRARVLRGHRQVRRILGRPPNTIEGLALRRPGVALRMLRDAFGDEPASFLPFLAVAVPVELCALLVSRWQELTVGRDDALWVPVE